MTAPVSVNINGSTITNIEESTFQVESLLGSAVSTATLKIHDVDHSIAIPEGMDITITRSDTGAKIFGGLTSIVDSWVDGRTRWWEIKAQSYNILLDTTIVYASYLSGFTYDGLTGDAAIIADLFENRVVGGLSTTSEIEARTHVIGSITTMSDIFFNYVTLREAMQTIANFTGRDFYVDANFYLHYYLWGELVSTLSLSDAPDYTTNVGYRNLRRRVDATQIRNSFLVFGNNMFSSTQTYYLPSDPAQTKFLLTYDTLSVNVVLSPIPGEIEALTVYVNTGTDVSPVWTTKLTVGIDGLDTMPAKDALFNAIGQYVTLYAAPGDFPTYGIKVEGVYKFSAFQSDTSAGSQSRYARAFTRRVSVNDPNAAASLTQLMATYKSELAYAMSKITLTVDDASFPAGSTDRYEVGQQIYLANTILGLSLYHVLYRKTTFIEGGLFKSYNLELRGWVSA